MAPILSNGRHLNCYLRITGTADIDAIQRCRTIAPMPYVDIRTGLVMEGRHCRGCWSFSYTPHRCPKECTPTRTLLGLSNLAFDLVWSEDMTLWEEHVTVCKGQRLRQKLYLPGTFLEHFKDCEAAQAQYGKMPPEGGEWSPLIYD